MILNLVELMGHIPVVVSSHIKESVPYISNKVKKGIYNASRISC